MQFSPISSQRSYSLRQSRRSLHQATAWYQTNWSTLTRPQLLDLEDTLEKLQGAVDSKDKAEASVQVRHLNAAFPQSLRKTYSVMLLQLILILVVVVLGSFVIRQMWFELYQIPTGSMRPTFREQDHVVVSKTTFGLNWPMQTAHLYFDPSLVDRTDIVVWSGDNIDLPDTNSRYLGLFPSKKRYIKRLMGKPGDTVYFYGGKVYGIDSQGNDISSQLQQPWMDRLEYIPFSTFEGRITTSSAKGTNVVQEIYINQMGQAIGRLILKGYGVVVGDIPIRGGWLEDNPLAQRIAHNSIETYSDFWGIGNYAMARLLTKEQVRQLTDINPDQLEDTVLYLELRHSPGLSFPKPRFQEGPDGRIRFLLNPFVTVIPLQEKQLTRIMDAMYTSRFVVHDSRASLFSVDGSTLTPDSPLFSTVPDGTYEMYYGKGYAVDWAGATQELPKDHPLYRKTPTNIQRLFNLGIEFDTSFSPTKSNQVDFPARYAYFRNGDLYVMGAPILYKDEPTLKYFVSHELERQKRSAKNKPYTAFIDHGSPTGKDGKLNKTFIANFGLKIPEDQYLVLGDNHSRSADSRYFGFVPQSNLQGSPTQIFWPRWETPPQPSLPWTTIPSTIIWTIVWLILAGLYYLYNRRSRTPFKRLSP
ncbi:MAG: signal peptidase I [Chlamydiales bacterium]|nr:signal peptidase I [Chlamydiales bacterium]